MTVTPSRAEGEGTTARRGRHRRTGTKAGTGTGPGAGAEAGAKAGTGTAAEKHGDATAGGEDEVQLPGARVATADATPGGTIATETATHAHTDIASGSGSASGSASASASGNVGPAGGRPAEVTPPTRGFLAKATLVTAVLSIAGALLGLGRDQALAHLFGAGTETDAFLVAWTVPEVAATLLIEDGMAFVLVPAFSLAVARRARGAAGDPVRALVASTLPRIALALVAVSALLMAGAPYLVAGLAPGLPDPGLAVDCTRLTATCVLSFGLAGYCSAALRAHRRFLAPAAIYVAYNTGIITAMFVLGGRWGCGRRPSASRWAAV